MSTINDFLATVAAQCEFDNISNDVSRLRAYFGQRMRICYDNSVQECPRLIFTSGIGKNAAINGLIINYIAMINGQPPIMSLPPPALSTRVKVGQALKRGDYTIYKINDGTIVTLYWCADKWCIGTAKSTDVSAHTWLSDRTFSELLYECLGAYPEFNIDNLSKSYCYTVGFRHHDIHPLITDPQCAWLVQARDLTNLAVVDVDIGLPQQEVVNVTYKDMQYNNITAMSNYLRTGVAHYGYILRDKTGALSDVMLSSSLLTFVNQVIYRLPKAKSIAPYLCIPARRLQYLMLRVSFDDTKLRLSYRIFPQYEPLLKKIGAELNNITTRLSAALELRSLPAPKDEYDNLVLALVNALHSKMGAVNPLSDLGKQIIADFVRDPGHIEMYYLVMFCREQ
jgi:hypothetical protein